MNKKSVRKSRIALIFIVILFLFTSVSISYALIFETLNISGTVSTYEIDPYFYSTYSSDPFEGSWEQISDAAECGDWVFNEEIWQWSGNTRNKNIGWFESYISSEDKNSLNIFVYDAYPSYYAHSFFSIRNSGTCPVQIHSLILRSVSFNGETIIFEEPVNLVPNTPYGIDINEGELTADIHMPVDNNNDDFSIMITGSDFSINKGLDPESWSIEEIDEIFSEPEKYNKELFGGICIHFENGCLQDSTYDFSFDMVFYNWEEEKEPQKLNIPPKAITEEKFTGEENKKINLDGSRSVDLDGKIVLFEWDFEGDGVFDYSSTSSGITGHIYKKGTYHPTLRVTDNNGESDQTKTVVYVKEKEYPHNAKPFTDVGIIYEPPHANAGGPYFEFLIDGEANILFDASKSYGTIESYSWTFGEFASSNEYNPSFTFTELGKFPISLRVTGPLGSSVNETYVIIVQVPNSVPIKPFLSGPRLGTKNTTYEFIAVSVDPDNDSLSYNFSWGDNSFSQTDFVPNASIVLVNHSWSHWGIYKVSVFSSDNKTESDSTSQIILIDVIWVKDIGYLIDADSNGIYDLFFSNKTLQKTLPQRLENGSYLIDDNCDGKFNYLYEVENDKLFEYNEIRPFAGKEDFWLLFILFLSYMLFILILYILYKRRNVVVGNRN